MRSLALIAVLLFTAGAGVASAAPLDVDGSFGQGGSAAFGVGAAAPTGSALRFAVPAAGGGFAMVGSSGDGARTVIGAQRFTAAGALVPGSLRQFAPADSGVENVAVDPDGAGGAYVTGARLAGDRMSAVVAHLGPDMSPDPSFGTGGAVTLPGPDGRVMPAGVTQQPDGRLLVAEYDDDTRDLAVRVHRLDADGSIDRGFGNAGVTAPVTISDSDDEGSLAEVVVGSSGAITAIGDDGGGQLRLVRWTASGAPDATFGTGGVLTVSVPGYDVYVRRALLDGSGRIVAVGQGYPGNIAIAVRLTAAGAVDTSFGVAGVVDTQPPGAPTGSEATAATIVGSTLYYAGKAGYAAAPTTRSVIWRVTAGNIATAVATPTTDLRPISIVTLGGSLVVADTVRAMAWDGSALTAGPVTTLASPPLAVGNPVRQIGATAAGGLFAATAQQLSPVLAFGAVDANGSADPVVTGNGMTLPTASRFEQVTPLRDGGAAAVGSQGAGTVVARLTRAGRADGSFGSAGSVTFPAATIGSAIGVAESPDGSLYVGGCTASELTVLKLTARGALDGTFGSGGRRQLTGAACPHAVAATADGGVVLDASASVKKLTGGGALDAGFGSGGAATLPASAEALTVAPDGRIVVGYDSGADAGLVRLTAAGQRDESFGSAGIATVPTVSTGFNLRPEKVAALPNGDYAIAAITYPSGGGGTRRVVAYVGSDGTSIRRMTGLKADDSGAAGLPDGRFAVGSVVAAQMNATMFLGRAPAAPAVAASASDGALHAVVSGDAEGLTRVTAHLDVGTTTDYGTRQSAALDATAGPQSRSFDLSLTPGTYHVRPVLSNASGTTFGADQVVVVPASAIATPPVGTPRRSAATARITLPTKAKRSRISAWKTLRGTAALSADGRAARATIRRVQVNLVRTLPRPRARKGSKKKRSTAPRCSVYTGKRFTTMTCAKANARWVTVRGTTRWTLAVKGLARKRYTLRARATDSRGLTQKTFRTGTSRVVLRLTKR